MQKRILIAFLFLSIVSVGSAQRVVGAIFSIHGGKVLPISTFFPATNGAFQIDAGAQFYADGSKYFHNDYKSRVIGLNYSFAGYGNAEVLGKSHSLLMDYCKFQPIKGRFSLVTKFGFGISYFTKPFDLYENPENLVIGSKFTALAHAGVGIGIKLNENLGVELNGAFRHNSGGHYKVPNIGANMILGSVSLRYIPQLPEQHIATEIEQEEKGIHPGLDVGFGLHEIEGTLTPVGGPKYPVYFVRAYASKRLNRRSTLAAGFVLNYDDSFYHISVDRGLFPGVERKNALKTTFFLGHELHFGHLAFFANAGFNVYYPFRKEQARIGLIEEKWMDQFLTHEIGGKWYLKDPLLNKGVIPSISVGIRTIGGKADFFAISLNTRF